MKMLKKQTCLVSLLIMALVFMVSLTSCGEDKHDEPEIPEYPNSNEDLFENLYGYWINTDKSGAMNIVKHNSEQCKVIYYVYTEHFFNNYAMWESYYSGYSFSVLAPYDESISGCAAVSVKISSSSNSRIVLTNNGSGSYLSSYIFTRVSEDEFFGYVLNGRGNTSDIDS